MDGASVPPPWASPEERKRAERFLSTQDDRVQILADGLTPELEEIYMLERWGGRLTLWAAWEIRHEVGETGMRAICTQVRDRDEE